MKEKIITSIELKKFVNSKEFKPIVQKKRDKYQDIWLSWAERQEYISFSSQRSWNWAAFFFVSLWFFYRKMYALAFIFIFIFLLIGMICGDSSASSGISFVISIFIGLKANVFYLKKCLKLEEEANQQFPSSPNNKELDEIQQKNRIDLLQKIGGVSVKAVLFTMLTLFIFIFSVTYVIYQTESTTNINSIKNGIFENEEDTYLGEVLENYKYFSEASWKEITQENGEYIIRFSAIYDYQSAAFDDTGKNSDSAYYDFLLSTKSLLLNAIANPNIELYPCELLIDFSSSEGNDFFDVDSYKIIVNDKVVFNGFLQYAIDNIYNAEPIMELYAFSLFFTNIANSNTGSI